MYASIAVSWASFSFAAASTAFTSAAAFCFASSACFPHDATVTASKVMLNKYPRVRLLITAGLPGCKKRAILPEAADRADYLQAMFQRDSVMLCAGTGLHSRGEASS